MLIWRNFIRLSEFEWLKDHQIDGSVVFPGAGYITSAIEAVRLITDPSEATIQGYKLREIDIVNMMIIPDSAFGLETQLSLHRCSDGQLDHGGWYEFRLCSLASGGSWLEHCRGFITADTNDGSKARTAELTRKVEAPRDDTCLQQGIRSAEDTAVTKVDIEALFGRFRERGIYHGPALQNLIDRRAAGHRIITNFAVAEVACTEHDYVLHPTILDSVPQASFSSLPRQMDKDTMVLPRSIRSLTMPRSLKRQGGDKLQAFSNSVQVEKHGYISNISIAAAMPDPEDGNSTFPKFPANAGLFRSSGASTHR
jgi:acyl transferase domain-containing protein